MRVRAWWLASALLTFGCEGVIGDLGSAGAGGGTGAGTGGSGGTYVPPDVTCDPTQFPDVRIEDALALFASDVYPAMTDGQSQCVSCHGAASNRRFTVTASATETFHQSRGAGFFRDEPGSLLARVTNPDDRVRMPLARLRWPDATVQALARVGCMIRAFEAGWRRRGRRAVPAGVVAAVHRRAHHRLRQPLPQLRAAQEQGEVGLQRRLGAHRRRSVRAEHRPLRWRELHHPLRGGAGRFT